MSISDLPDVVGTVLARIETPTPDLRHRLISKHAKAENFYPHEFLSNQDDLVPIKIQEGGEVPATGIGANLETLQIETLRLRTSISREALFSGNLNIVDVPRLMLKSAYRTEAADTYAALEANANLADGLPLFGTGNTATGATLSDIGAALGAFRSQTVSASSAQLSGLEPRFFVVPSGSEIDAATNVRNSGLNIEVIATSLVTASYLLADPQDTPILTRLALTEDPEISTRSAPFESAAAIVIDLVYDFKIAATNRVGIVKMTL